MRGVWVSLAVLAFGMPCLCAAADAPLTGTTVELTLVGGSALNPNTQGQPSPVEVRIFQLSTPRAFEAADFASVFRTPQGATQTDWLEQEDFMLRPGQIHEHKRSPGPAVQALGVAAAFRDQEQAVWHVTVPLRPNRLNLILIDLDHNTIRLMDRDPP